MASIETRTTDNGDKSYRVKVRLKGYPTQSATFDRLTDAKKWAAATESAIREGRHFKTAEAKKHTIADMIDRYLSGVSLTKEQNEHIGLHLRRWKDEIGFMVLADVQADTITKIRDKLLSGCFKSSNNSFFKSTKHQIYHRNVNKSRA